MNSMTEFSFLEESDTSLFMKSLTHFIFYEVWLVMGEGGGGGG